MAKTNVYVIFDTVADEPIVISTSKTDGLFVRNNLPYVSKMNPNYLMDYVIYHVGYFVDSELSLESCSPRVVDWDSYKFPEQVEGALKPKVVGK